MYGILQQSAFAETKKEVLLMFGSSMSKTSEKYAQINLYIPHDGSKRPLQIAQQPGKAVTAIKPSTCPAPRLSSTLSPGMSKGQIWLGVKHSTQTLCRFWWVYGFMSPQSWVQYPNELCEMDTELGLTP